MRAVPAISARWAAIGPPESARQRPRKGQCRRDLGGSAPIRRFGERRFCVISVVSWRFEDWIKLAFSANGISDIL